MVDPDGVAGLARIEGGKGSTGEDDKKIRGLEGVAKF